MARSRTISTSLAVLAALLAGPAPAATALSPAAKAAAGARSLLQSRQLWATIDVCNPSDQPDTVGIRGSMPGDGQARDQMYMRFGLQYFDGASKRWLDLANGAAPSFVAVGTGKSARQAGRSFQLVPVPGKPAFRLRGIVTFQWRRSRRVLQSASRTTAAGHKSLAGADPPGFSAAECSIG